MNYSFEYIDIILLAMIAGFIFLRLRGILGKRTGFEGKATPQLMMECGGKIAPWMASITFGGRDLKTVYIGSLRGTNIPFFRSPISGLPLIHW